jgi:hypothetical protein
MSMVMLRRSISHRTKSGGYATVLLYGLPVVFGGMAILGGILALQHPGGGLGLLAAVMVGYIAASVPLVRMIDSMRAERGRSVVSLVRPARRGVSGVGRDDPRQDSRSPADGAPFTELRRLQRKRRA